jgi:predicted nuclease with TOPRIM domain
MADAKKRASPPSVPPKEPIEEGKPISTTNRAKEESRTKSRPDSTSGQKESKREGQDISYSPEKRLHKTSSANTKMVDSPENGDWVEVPSRELVQESNGQGYQGQTQSALHDLMELDSPSIADKVLNDDSASQSPIMPKATLPHPAEFQSLEELAGFGNNNSTTHCNEKLREQNCQLDRRIQDLQRQLSTLTTDKQIAEEKSDTLSEKLNSLKQRMNSNMTEVEISSEALADKVEELGKENRALREQLNDAQSHIFSLQPYRKELTSEEVGQEYDDLVEQVQDWVQKFMDPWLDDHREGVDALLSNAKRRAVDATRFKHLLYQYPDLIHGASFPETDEDIITSVIMRYLHDHIFQTVLYGMIARYVEVISFIEKEMQMSVEPKRDLFSVRTWTAEAYNALLSSPQFKAVRNERREAMTRELANILKIFFKKDQFNWFCQNTCQRVIVPAMKLYEKLQISTNHFYLDVNSFIVRAGGELTTSTDFIDTLENLDCKNVLQNRKTFNLGKLDPTPSKKELYHRLHNVCTVVPALYMRQIGQRDAIKDPIVVRKQQMLVAWGPEEKRNAYQENGDRTLVSHLYGFKGTGEGWTSFLR